MTKEKALEIALAVLEEIADEVFSPYDNKLGGAILAIKEALAQPEQEPVAWWDAKLGVFDEKHFDQLKPLYTTPPKREWVGLTTEQFVEAAWLAEAGNYLVAFQRIQQWLREENT